MSSSKPQHTRSMYKNQLQFYILSNEKSKNDTKEKIPSKTTSKKNEILRHTKKNDILTKEVQALYTENYKTLLRKSKDLSKWRDIPGP